MKPNEPTPLCPRVAVAPGLGPRWSTLLLHALAVYQDIQHSSVCARAFELLGQVDQKESCECVEAPPRVVASE